MASPGFASGLPRIGNRVEAFEIHPAPVQAAGCFKSPTRYIGSRMLNEFHAALNARFTKLSGQDAVADYGDVASEYAALRERAGVLDLSFRGRLCLTGADRVRFLHGQVTNDIKRLGAGDGCYAALTTAKGRMESDLYIYNLAEELLLDFEPGLAEAVSRRLEKFLVADDVQVVDVSPHYGLLSVQGPVADAVLSALELFPRLPTKELQLLTHADATLGELCLVNQPRLGMHGFDLFVPVAALGAVADKLVAAAKASGGRPCGWTAFEAARIEAGMPRFGVDMDGTNLPQETGIESRAVSYTKGCYIGQEVLNRLHTMGHVNRELRRLSFTGKLEPLPIKGDKLFREGKEAGQVTSAAVVPGSEKTVALAYLKREMAAPGTELTLARAEQPAVGRVLQALFTPASAT